MHVGWHVQTHSPGSLNYVRARRHDSEINGMGGNLELFQFREVGVPSHEPQPTYKYLRSVGWLKSERVSLYFQSRSTEVQYDGCRLESCSMTSLA